MKDRLKKLLRFVLRTLAGIAAFALLYLLCAFLFSRIPVNTDFAQAKDGVTIYIESNGVHTDIVVPVQNEQVDWTKYFPHDHFEDVDESFEHIAFGWGDKGFYLETPTWADLKFTTAFKAVFWLGSTAMHVTYKSKPPKNPELSKKITISKEEYQRLTDYILSSFEKDAAGNIMRIDHEGYSDQDCFYEAYGTYSFLKTCNVWTGNGLKESGVRVGWWTPFDSSVFNQLAE
jgi:uncharacterized protein (TIGR02117 family)